MSLNEKLPWDLGKKPYVVLRPKCCVHIWKEKGKPTPKLYWLGSVRSLYSAPHKASLLSCVKPEQLLKLSHHPAAVTSTIAIYMLALPICHKANSDLYIPAQKQCRAWLLLLNESDNFCPKEKGKGIENISFS